VTITYWVRFINDTPAAVMRTVQTENTLEGEILRKDGWKKHSEALRFLQGDIDASEATRDQAAEMAALIGLSFPDCAD
jgi:hypothetical protein